MDLRSARQRARTVATAPTDPPARGRARERDSRSGRRGRVGPRRVRDAAVLVQVKTVLDNADGQLARVTGRVTLAGRYLDTEADLVVNAALVAALGHATGQPWLALAGFLALTLVLAADYNLSELYREVRGVAQSPPASSGGRLENLLQAIYRIVFAPGPARPAALGEEARADTRGRTRFRGGDSRVQRSRNCHRPREPRTVDAARRPRSLPLARRAGSLPLGDARLVRAPSLVAASPRAPRSPSAED